jgi:AcrR family transcriptional regulator
MEFRRARNDEQRSERRRAILQTTATMLTEMPVARLSLNELSRRVGLAKSNVLRYFESREAILLDLLNSELRDWIDELESSLAPIEANARERGDRLGSVIATSMAGRSVMCDLISAQASVLERNVSTQVALRYKRETAATIEPLTRLIAANLPELDQRNAYRLVVITFFTAGAAWPHSQPSEALAAAYAADPVVAATFLDFIDVIRETLQIAVSGLIARL